jgi:outer membrane protein assembly factor BamB
MASLANGVIYIGWDDNGTPLVPALDASTGASIWETKVSGAAGPQIVANGVVYVRSDRLSALRADTGEVLWT